MICPNLHPYPHFSIDVPPYLVQQQRGVDVSTEAWKSAVDCAERLVLQAEKKLERQKRSCSSQVAKLEVRTFFSSLFAIVNINNCFFLQARNDTLLQNEREAYETVRSNNNIMRKVYARHHATYPKPNRES